MQFGEDAPLSEEFDRNPLEYMQNFVKNMNNQIFLSEYHINNLYALLLIGRSAPWDNIKPLNSQFKEQVNEVVEKRVNQVNFLLQKLSQIYEDKAKKNAFSQIERLMSIIRAKNKSIFIQKSMRQADNCTCSEGETLSQEKEELKEKQLNFEEKAEKQKIQKEEQHEFTGNNKNESQSTCLLHKQESQAQSGQIQVFGLFAGLANLPNLSTLALGNCLDYNSTERYIKFKMTKNYIMTIKNQDPISYDLTSRVSKVPSTAFVHHIFPYLTAWQLFRMRGVCKEWLSYVKQSWHTTFKRQMYVQLLACQFCKDIEFYYKCIQLRNPFFQKLSLLMHALIQIIEWNTLEQALTNNTISEALKRVLLVLLKLLGDNIKIQRINDFTEQLWEQHKQKINGLKERVTQFFSNLSGTNLSIQELRLLKTHILDHPFLRGEQLQTESKTPLLLLIFIKQLTLQQLIKNHLYFSQEYLLNSKKRLDAISAKMHNRKGFLEGVYKVLLLKSLEGNEDDKEEDPNQMPSFQEMIQSIFENQESNKPDFVIKTKNSKTNIFMDKATKLDIIISTVKKIQEPLTERVEEEMQRQNQKEEQQILEQVAQEKDSQSMQNQKQEDKSSEKDQIPKNDS